MQNGFYPDVFTGSNIYDEINATDFPYNTSWWYRTTFLLPQTLPDNGAVSLHFQGINYRANIWLNGKLVANSSLVVGTFRYFEFDVTQQVILGGVNALAIEVFRPYDPGLDAGDAEDLAITFVDWAPQSPDFQGGLWRGTSVSITGPLTLRFPLLTTSLPAGAGGPAALDLLFEVTNPHGQAEAAATLAATLFAPDGITVVATVSQSLTVPPASTIKVAFSHTSYPQLNIATPQLWWPWQMGEPTLHFLNASLLTNGGTILSDSLYCPVGLRQAQSEIDSQGHLLLSVNTQRILIRGAGWAPDLFLRPNHARTLAELQYVRSQGLNAIRIEGQFPPDDLFSHANELGIIVLPGVACCDMWQQWTKWDENHYHIAGESLRSQFARLRVHPSVVAFFTSSDQLPPARVEQLYLNMSVAESFPVPLIAAASAATSKISGPTGVKMSGPYSYVPPNYWMTDTSRVGGAFGFLTEGGPGESPMALESIVSTIPAPDRWPAAPDSCWQHCGAPAGNFGNLDRFNAPLYARYWTAGSLEEYAAVSAVQVYEGIRAMYEGYSRNKYTRATGVIQWMLNSAWPSNVWNLFSYDLNPTAAYFAAKAACAPPLHVLYGYDNAAVSLVNSLYADAPLAESSVTATLFTPNGTVLERYVNGSLPSLLAADGVMLSVLQLPTQVHMRSRLGPDQTYFVRLRTMSASGSIVEENTYWLSTTEDVLDWDASTWFNTPCTSFANYSTLRTSLPSTVNLQTQTSRQSQNTTQAVVTYPIGGATGVAFFVRARLVDAISGNDILPVRWTDNYIVAMLPGESVTLTASYDGSALSAAPLVLVSCVNDQLPVRQE